MPPPRSELSTVTQSSYIGLLRREPKNPNAPGLQNNKNGPPGPEGNQKGPPGAAATEVIAEPGTATSEVPPIETATSDNLPVSQDSSATPDALTIFSSSAGSDIITPSAPTPPTTSEVSLLATTISSPDPGSVSSSTSIASTRITDNLSSSTSFVLTVPLVNPSSLAPTSSNVSNTLTLASTASTESSPTETPPLTSTPAKTTSSSILAYSTSATAMETPWGYQSQNGTIESESHRALSQGQKAGIVIGTLVGFSLILSLLYWLFKRREGEHFKSLLRFGRRQRSESPDPDLPSQNRPFNLLPDSPMVEAILSREPAWNYQETSTRPPMIAKARQSLTRSLRFLRVNPLGMNPVTPPDSRPRTASRKSFASSFFHRRSTASTLRSVSVPACEEQPVAMRGPHSLRPLFIPPFKLKPASQSARFSEATKSATCSTNSLTIPPPTLQHPTNQQQRHSHLSTSSADRDPRSAKAIFDRTRPHHPSKLSRSHNAGAVAGEEVPQGSEKHLLPPLLPSVLPQRPLSMSSTSWKSEKVLRPSNSLLDGHLDVLCANTGDGNKSPPLPLKSPKRTSAALSGKAEE